MDKCQGKTYQEYTGHKRRVLFAIAVITIALSFASLMAGSADISILDAAKAIVGTSSRQLNAIVRNIRLPRLATAASVGASLAMCGAVMQNVLRNPLASASTLGVSQGASFGAAVVIAVSGAGSMYLVSAAAFCGGMITTLVILALSKLRDATPSAIVLSGVALSSMFSGATALIQYFADDEVVASIVYWTFGNLGRAGWKEIAMIASSAMASFVFFISRSWDYNAIESGENTARSLGVNTALLIPVSLVFCALISSVSVAFTGCISFIGLIAPHIVRRFTGNDFRFLIPGSALAGAGLLIAADIASRMVIPPVVLPVGALTSFMGAPLFLYLVFRRRRIG